MEKQIFLDQVSQTLLANGLSPAAVDRQIDKLSRYIDEEGGENAEAMLDEEDPVLLAEEICAILHRNAARRAAAEAVAADDAQRHSRTPFPRRLSRRMRRVLGRWKLSIPARRSTLLTCLPIVSASSQVRTTPC